MEKYYEGLKNEDAHKMLQDDEWCKLPLKNVCSKRPIKKS